jgi:predicted PurR-regulated permease PerM
VVLPVVSLRSGFAARWVQFRRLAWFDTKSVLGGAAFLVIVLVGLVVSIVVATARFVTLLSEYDGELQDLVDQVTAGLDDAGVSADQVAAVTGGLDPSRAASALTSVLSGVAGLVSGIAFIVTLLLFMTIDSGPFPRQLEFVGTRRRPFSEAMGGFAHSTRRYLVVSTVFGLVVALLDTAALALMGLPAPLLWGLLAFLTNYIPNIGFVIGLVPPAILALLEGGPGLMLAVIAVYSLLNLVIQSVIQPKVVGDAVGLSASLSFLSLVFWAWVLGPLGAVLAIPMTLFVRALLVEADPESRWVIPLVANRADESR